MKGTLPEAVFEEEMSAATVITRDVPAFTVNNPVPKENCTFPFDNPKFVASTVEPSIKYTFVMSLSLESPVRYTFIAVTVASLEPAVNFKRVKGI